MQNVVLEDGGRGQRERMRKDAEEGKEEDDVEEAEEGKGEGGWK